MVQTKQTSKKDTVIRLIEIRDIIDSKDEKIYNLFNSDYSTLDGELNDLILDIMEFPKEHSGSNGKEEDIFNQTQEEYYAAYGFCRDTYSEIISLKTEIGSPGERYKELKKCVDLI